MTDRKKSLFYVRGRMLAVLCVPPLVVAMTVFALGGVASAHVVTSITADCYRVTVQFSDFPDSGVMVHIAADVNSQLLSTDVLVTSATSEAQLDISPTTTKLFGAPAHIDVDVTWIFHGPQHVHTTLTETCGSSTTTTQASTTTVTEASTTTAVPVTTTGVRGLGSTTVATATSVPPTAPETVGPQGSASPPTTAAALGSATLPRTGSNTAFPMMFGLSALVAGVLLIVRGRVSSNEQGLE